MTWRAQFLERGWWLLLPQLQDLRLAENNVFGSFNPWNAPFLPHLRFFAMISSGLPLLNIVRLLDVILVDFILHSQYFMSGGP